MNKYVLGISASRIPPLFMLFVVVNACCYLCCCCYCLFVALSCYCFCSPHGSLLEVHEEGVVERVALLVVPGLARALYCSVL